MSVGLREELKRQKRRQAELLTRLSLHLAFMAAHVAGKQLPTVSTMSDMGVVMSIGETLMANQTLEGIMGTMEQIAKGATAAPRADIPAPDVTTTQ
jgi:hypothetical protein